MRSAGLSGLPATGESPFGPSAVVRLLLTARPDGMATAATIAATAPLTQFRRRLILLALCRTLLKSIG